MNPRERMIAVLQHRKADRVPIAEMWIDPSIVRAVIGSGGSNELADHLDMDVVTVPTMVYDQDEVEWVDREAAHPLFRDKWGALQIMDGAGVPVPTKPPRIETAADLARYAPPDPADSLVVGKIRQLKERYPNGERAIAVVAESGWAPAVYLRGGLENLLLDFALRPDFVKDLMKVGADYYAELLPCAIRAGADLCFLGDDYSDKNGPMMSPRQFEEIILPCDAKVVAAIKGVGGYVIKHTDGDIRKIMDGLVDTGLDGLGPLEPVPGMELDGVLGRYPGRITVMGNIDVDLLSRGSVDDVIRATKRLLATVSDVGSHIMSSANTIASSVAPENFVAMVRTAQEFGTYPIDTESLLAELDG